MKKKNRFFEILDVAKCRKLIKACPKDEIAILCPHFSINIVMEYNKPGTEGEQIDWDWQDFEKALGYNTQVSDFDDLIVDVHGLLND